jgi:hypothetical protein
LKGLGIDTERGVLLRRRAHPSLGVLSAPILSVKMTPVGTAAPAP